MSHELVSLERDIDLDLIERARGDILAFTMATKEDYAVNWHHKKLAKKLNDFAFGKIQYLMVFMPPRHGKSELVSRRLPAFLHGLYPDVEIMAASYLDSLAGDMTIDVQKIIDSKEYKSVFPRTSIYPPSTSYTKGTRNSSEHHIVGHLGKYRGQGVGGSFTGKGANFIIIDDPIKGREIADSVAFRERLWNFYNNDLFSRLETNLETGRQGQVLITQCMTGDTLVLMADGAETPLRDIKVGDAIATFDSGHLATSRVKNWRSCGPDLVFAIRTSSGITVKANERHPFLVCRDGELKWKRLKELETGESLVRLGVCGRAKSAHFQDAKSQLAVRHIALPTITKHDGLQDIDPQALTQSPDEPHTFGKGTESRSSTTTECLKIRTENAPSVDNHQADSTCLPIGSKCALTIATLPGKSGACSATNVTSPLSTPTMKKYCSEPLSTFEFTLDLIEAISSCGTEDVFDIEVDRTENFIANGLVSHNTRWHEGDLSGRLLDLMKNDPNSIQWDVVCYPAIREDLDDPSDPRAIGEPLWKKKYNNDQLSHIKASIGPRAWSSLYQQSPVPDGGGLFRDEMFGFCDINIRDCDWSFVMADTSYKEKQENDFTVFTVFGVRGDTLYVVDAFRKQMKASDVQLQVEPFIRKYMSNYGYRGTYIEPKGHGIYLNQTWARGGLGIPGETTIKEFYTDRRLSKVERANNVVPHLANRKVYFNNIIENKESLLAECLTFPKGKHDDFVDTLVDGLKMAYGRPLSLFDVM